ncbi:MAG: amidohydrolase family protein [Gammaproteobacteria bacterium]|nr:amidohydrolase family protein [Gammaproteobacteria bacterium]
MQSSATLRTVAAAGALLLTSAASGQDLAITNARVLDGTGAVLDRGTIVVRDGRIESVSANAQAPGNVRTIDAAGRTVMPGFVEAHRHIVDGDPNAWLEETAAEQMQEFLEAGFTTVVSAIDPPQLLEARQRIEQGAMQGPRIFAAAFVPLAGPMPGSENQPEGDPARFDASRRERPSQAAPAIPREATITAIENAARAGYDYLKTVIIVTPGGPEVETLKLVVEEGRRHGLPTITHAVSVQDTVAAVEAGPASLVHTPHIGHLGDQPDALQKIVDAGIPMMSTLAVFIPHFDEDNEPLFRDGLPFPWETLSSGGQGPVNARLLWEAGLTSYGYGTDTSWPPKESLIDELRALRTVFSPEDVVSIITKNAAEAALQSDEIGTLEPGKLADIVIVDGDPLEASSALLNVVTTIKGGEVVFEQ